MPIVKKIIVIISEIQRNLILFYLRAGTRIIIIIIIIIITITIIPNHKLYVFGFPLGIVQRQFSIKKLSYS